MMMQAFTPVRLMGAVAVVAVVLAGCTSTAPPPEPVAKAVPPAPAPAPAPAPVAKAPEVAQPAFKGRSSNAATPRAYRADAAGHLYGLHKDRIYKGRMPPLLYAVGVLNFEVDERGAVHNVNWMRAPRHAPEVMAEIEKMVRTAAPYPAPAKLGRVSYTDTWLWHKSGKWQLDTLTEGQD